MVITNIRSIYPLKCSKPYVESDIFFLMRKFVEEISCKMERSCRSCHRSIFLCKSCLVISFFGFLVVYIWRKWELAISIHDILYSLPMGTDIPSMFGYSGHFEISCSEVYFCSNLEIISWPYKCLESTVNSFLAKKDLPIFYTFFSSVRSFCMYIFQADTCSEDTRIIEKYNSILRNVCIKVPKSWFDTQYPSFSIYNHKTSIMVRMYSLLGDKLWRKYILVVRTCVHSRENLFVSNEE